MSSNSPSETNEDFPSYEDTRESFFYLVDNGTFSLEIDGEVVEPDADGITGSANISCPDGSAHTSEGSCGMLYNSKLIEQHF